MTIKSQERSDMSVSPDEKTPRSRTGSPTAAERRSIEVEEQNFFMARN